MWHLKYPLTMRKDYLRSINFIFGQLYTNSEFIILYFLSSDSSISSIVKNKFQDSIIKVISINKVFILFETKQFTYLNENNYQDWMLMKLHV